MSNTIIYNSAGFWYNGEQISTTFHHTDVIKTYESSYFTVFVVDREFEFTLEIFDKYTSEFYKYGVCIDDIPLGIHFNRKTIAINYYGGNVYHVYFVNDFDDCIDYAGIVTVSGDTFDELLSIDAIDEGLYDREYIRGRVGGLRVTLTEPKIMNVMHLSNQLIF